MDELKTCPLCGGSNIQMERKTTERHRIENGKFRRMTLSERYKISCGSCLAETAFAFYLEDAINAWNRRAENG